MEIFLGELLLCVLLALYAFYDIRKWRDRQKMQNQQQEKQAVLRMQKETNRLEASIQKWLMSLELPQFGDRTKLEASSRQLGTVLIVELLGCQTPYLICKEGLPSMPLHQDLQTLSDSKASPPI